MKQFRFPLQAVLTFRRGREDRALEAYARAQAEQRQIKQKCRDLEQEIELLHERRRQVWSGAASSEQIQQMQHGLRALQERWRHGQAELAKQQSVVDEKWKILLDERQKRESMDKLQEKQRASHQMEAARMDQHLADEIALLKSAHGSTAKWR
jgi:flagellar export protein FliJ